MGLYVSKSSGDGVGGGRRRSRMRRRGGGGENVKIHICSFASWHPQNKICKIWFFFLRR